MKLVYKKSIGSWGVKASAGSQNFVFEPKRIPPKMWGVLSKDIFEEDKKNNSQSPINIFQLFNKSSQQIWLEAQKSSYRKKSKRILAADLFTAALNHQSLNTLWKRLELDTEDVKTILKNHYKLSAKTNGEDLQKLPFVALEENVKLNCSNISPPILLYGLMVSLNHSHIVEAIFTHLKLAPAKLEVLACWILKLDFKFTKSAQQQKFLDCFRRLKILEQHNRCLFTYPAVELAIHHSSSVEAATKILVKASLQAKLEKNKIIDQAQIKKFLR